MANLSQHLKIFLFFLFIIFSFSLSAQDDDKYTISFKSSSYLPPAGSDDFQNKRASFSSSLVKGKYHLLVQFNDTPDMQALVALNKEGVHLLRHYGAEAYFASIPQNFDTNTAAQYGIRGIGELPIFAKLSPDLFTADFPEWAVKTQGFVDVKMKVAANIDLQYAHSELKAAGIQILEGSLENLNQITARISADQLQAIAKEGYVAYIEPIEAPLESLNHKNPMATRSSYLRANHARSLKLTGEGVVVGVGDGGLVTGHIDTEDRIVNLTTDDLTSWYNHQDMITGIITGVGNLDPWFTGIASKVTVLAHRSSQIFLNSVTLHADYGMTLTNNSYGPGGMECHRFGIYDTSSEFLDKNLKENPELLHLFACGNSGDDNCQIYPNGHGTIIRSYASSKNTLAVGATFHRGGIVGFSSKGPTADGRIKPEIVTPGFQVKSTSDNNTYIKGSGTSMSTAVATGDMALLSELYKRENNGANPEGALLKAIVANTATDHGNPGPDFAYGFGQLNSRRAAKVIQDKSYFHGELSNHQNNNHTINLPSDAYGVKVMLYWHDTEGNPAVAHALVNDLDLEVVSNGKTFLPWTLDPTPAKVEMDAERKVDALNNIEQVTLSSNELAAGQSITVNVKGTHIADGPQKYVLVYDIIVPEVKVTYPAGGEDFIPGYKGELIRWDATGPQAQNVIIEYSLDNGNSWTEIPTTADGQFYGYVDWSIPANANTSVARIRATMSGTSMSDVNEPFQIIPFPTNLTTEVICKDQVRLSWTGVADAKQYEVLLMDKTTGFMKVVGTTTNTNFLVSDMPTDNGNPMATFLSVRAISKIGDVGRQAVSVAVTPSGESCASISDVGVTTVVSPSKNGRQFTSMSLGNQPITVEITNHGNQIVGNFPVNFQVNEGTTLTEIFRASLAPGESANHTFSSTTDMTAVGTYSLNAWTTLPDDSMPSNDRTPELMVVQQIANPSFTSKSFPFNINFDQIVTNQSQENTTGLTGIQVADYNTTGLGGRLRINENSSFNDVGSTKALTLDATYPIAGKVTNELVLTFNLAAMNSDLEELGFQFDYMQHQQEADPTNKVFARGSDTDAWVAVYNLFDNQVSSGNYKRVERTDILPILAAAGQALTSSFQIKFCQTGTTGAENPYGNDGYTFDNIRLDDGTTLPVELAYFDAEKSGLDAIIKWSTHTEINNRIFHVEYANGYKDGNIGDWKLLEKVRGAGNSSKPQYYQAIDKNLDKTDYRYYRLLQVDFDGSSSYSTTRVVNFKSSTVSMEVFPNPTTDFVNIKIDGMEKTPINIQLTDMAGKVLERIERPAAVEDFTIETIKIGDEYPEGFYIISVFMGESKSSHKIYKRTE